MTVNKGILAVLRRSSTNMNLNHFAWSGPALQAEHRWAHAATKAATRTTETMTRTCFLTTEAGTRCHRPRRQKIAIAMKTQILGPKVETSVGVDLALKGSKHLETGVGFGEICRTVVCVKSSVLSSGGDNKSSFPSLCFCVLHFFVFVCTLFVSGQYNCSCYGKPTCECV